MASFEKAIYSIAWAFVFGYTAAGITQAIDRSTEAVKDLSAKCVQTPVVQVTP